MIKGKGKGVKVKVEREDIVDFDFDISTVSKFKVMIGGIYKRLGLTHLFRKWTSTMLVILP